MLTNVEAIVVKSIDFLEGDRIITLFTREQGKVAILARGAKKNNSRLNAVTQVFMHGKFIYFRKRNANMGTLNSGECVKHFSAIYADIEKTAYAAYLVELVDRISESDQANVPLFELLLSALEQIAAGKDAEVVVRIFEMKLFQIIGILPQLGSCSVCDGHAELVGFSINRGGLLCKMHLDEASIILQENTIRLLRIFVELDLSQLGEINLRAETRDELRRVTEGFCDQYIGIALKSRGFLELLREFEE